MARHKAQKQSGKGLRLVLPLVALAVLVVVGVGLAVTVGPVAPPPDQTALSADAPTGLAQIDRTELTNEGDAAAEGEDATEGEADAAAPATLPAGPSTAGALHVEGSQLMDQTNRPIQLRGISTHGLAWYPEYVNEELFHELRQDWGVNVVRLALYPAEEGGYSTGGDRDKLEKTLIKGIEYATAADLYVVVDWHTLTDKSPWWNAEDAKALLGRVSERFKDNVNVLYEICNEPNDDTTWSSVKGYATEMIPVIRANDPDAVIITGTPNWSQDVAAAAADPLPFDNVLYSLHFYAATHQQELRDALRKAVDDGLPVFVSEFGICEASGDGKIDYESADAWVELMDQLNVSYICWNLSNKDEKAALIKKSCKKTSGFTAEDLTKEGRWLAQVLKSPGFDQEALRLADAPKRDNQAGAAMMLPADGTLQWKATVSNMWEENGKTFFQYDLTGSNYSAAVKEWSLIIPFSGVVTVEDSWNCQAAAKGAMLAVTNDAHNGAVAAGATVDNVGFIVSGSASLAVVDQ